ncbi:MAG: DUF501 domain-containing protein [Desertimonas sp.]
MTTERDELDIETVRARLGRDPLGAFRVVRRDDDGPVVIENAPLLDDGTPMPTRFWLLGPRQVLAVSRLEAAGGVRAADAAVDPAALRAAHDRYAAARDATIPDGHVGPRPSGGVGGTRAGVKCLHAHYAWYLTGGDDPVGRWVDEQLRRRVEVVVGRHTVTVSHAGFDIALPVGPDALLADQLTDLDPPPAAQLTNAIGAVADHLDDVVRAHPAVEDAPVVTVAGADPWHLAVVERGSEPPEATVTLARDEAEEVFRALATERRGDRLHNPGLDPAQVDRIVATACIVVGVTRKLQLDQVTLTAGVGP